MKVTDLLKKDHASVRKLFSQFGQTTPRAVRTRQGLVERIATELDIHAQVEEEIFYPAVRGVADHLVQEAEGEHKEIKALVAEIRGMAGSDIELASKMTELKNAVLHHAREEEREMFWAARNLGPLELERLGDEIKRRKDALKESSQPGMKEGSIPKVS